MSDEQPHITRDDEAQRFVLAEAPEDGYLDFEQTATELILRHTEVDGALEGRGVGGALVRAALDHAEEAGLTVVPRCGFVAGWLDRHPERAAELDIAGR